MGTGVQLLPTLTYASKTVISYLRSCQNYHIWYADLQGKGSRNLSHSSYTQDKLHNLQSPVQNENAGLLLKNH